MKNFKLTKYEGNPILAPNPANEWEEKCVLNPTVIYDEPNERFVMLYRDRRFLGSSRLFLRGVRGITAYADEKYDLYNRGII